MFSNIGVPGLILILILALIIFGPSKLPDIGRSFGRSIKEFKDATSGIFNHEADVNKSTVTHKKETNYN